MWENRVIETFYHSYMAFWRVNLANLTSGLFHSIPTKIRTMDADSCFRIERYRRERTNPGMTKKLTGCLPPSNITCLITVTCDAIKIWWLCQVFTSTTRFASDVGYRMAKNLIGLYKENNFHEQRRLIPWQRMKNMIFHHKFWRPFLDCMPQLFLTPKMCGFLYICRFLWTQTLVVNWQN